MEKEPEIAKNYFYEEILPYILPLVPFGNYLIQKLCKTLDDQQIKMILDKMAPTILDIGEIIMEQDSTNYKLFKY